MKNIVAFDVETTGLNKTQDHIIQLSAIKFNPETFKVLGKHNWYIRPEKEFAISPSAQSVHGISKEFLLEHGILLREIGPKFIEFCKDCDILTYNGNKFDIQFICKDLAEIDLEFDLTGRTFFDSYAIECRMHPRNLAAVYQRRTGKILEGAHNALNDIDATIEVFHSQLEDLTKLGMSYDDISAMEENNLFCAEGTLRNASDVPNEPMVVFAVGKYKDSEFLHVLNTDPDYIRWYLGTVGIYTKQYLRDYCKKYKNIYLADGDKH